MLTMSGLPELVVNESAEHKAQRDSRFATLERYNSHLEFVSRFQAQRYRMKALLGPAADEPYRLMHEAVTTVIVSARMLIMRVGQQWSGDVDQYERDVWETGSPDDRVAPKVAEAVSLMENICRPILLQSK